MIFSDLLLNGGGAHSICQHDTDYLHPEAVPFCQLLLQWMREGALEVWPNVPGMPRFSVSLDLPEWVQAHLGQLSHHPGRIFSLRAEGSDRPFSMHLALGPDASMSIDIGDPRRDDLAASAIVGVSLLLRGVERPVEDLKGVVEKILSLRPTIATAIDETAFPDYDTLRSTMAISGDFSRCFAAALLLE